MKKIILVISALLAAIVVCVFFSIKLTKSYEVVNAHEHMQSINEIPKYLDAAKKAHVIKTIIVGSSDMTLLMDENVGFLGYLQNNEELLKISAAYPDQFISYVAIDPLDDGKVERLQDYVKRGAKGVKLYLGHGQQKKLPPDIGKEVYHVMRLDDERMGPLYKYCEDSKIPILFHVNVPKYDEEFESVLKKYPKLIIICPHFLLSLSKMSRLNYYFEKYPQLYTDISFGYYKYTVDGFRRISKLNEEVRDFVVKYSDRILFGTDMVVTKKGQYKSSTAMAKWMQGYKDMLEKKKYSFFLEPNEKFRGLYLDDKSLRNIYTENFKRLTSF